MTTWYVSQEDGTDSNASAGNGDSFATRRKSISNVVAAALAPGDEIRVMGSPAPTSLGNATWTSVNGSEAERSINSTSNTTPISITVGGTVIAAMGVVAGDTVLVRGVNTNTPANGIWKVGSVDATSLTIVNADGSNSVGIASTSSGGVIRKATNMAVTLATACTQNIACCGNQGTKTNWTGSANVTPTVITSDFKEGGECQQIAIAAGFTTGLAAYVPTGTLDLSSYQQISFWIKLASGTVGADGAVRIDLYPNADGTGTPTSFNVPSVGATSRWRPVVVDNGSALPSSVKSIGLYVVTDNGAQTFLIDNIIACKAPSAADSLNLTSLISKNAGDEAWFGIQSINGTRIMLDGINATTPAASPQRGYYGTTETVTTYKRETIKTVAAAATSTQVQTVQDSGTSGNLITISGGWNRADMSTQDGVTWLDGQNGYGNGLYSQTKSFVSYDKLNFARYNNGLLLASSSNDNIIGTAYFCNTTSSPLNDASQRNTYTKLIAVNCGGSITLGAGSITDTIARADSSVGGVSGVALGSGAQVTTIAQASNNGGSGVSAGLGGRIGIIQAAHYNSSYGYTPQSNSYLGSLTANYNGTSGFNPGSIAGATIAGGSTEGNASGGIYQPSGTTIIRNFTINESTEVATPIAFTNGKIISENHDATAGYHVHFCDGGRIETQTTVKYSPSSYAWKISPTSANRTVNYPLTLTLGRRYIIGATTFKVWMQRSNTDLTMRLVCKGGQIAGVTSDVISSMAANADTWEQVSITVSPSAAGVVEIEAQAYGGTTYSGYVSVMEIA